jgi:hypothetical protein
MQGPRWQAGWSLGAASGLVDPTGMPSPTLVRDEPATKRFPIHARHLPIDQSNTERVVLVETAKTAWRAVAFAVSSARRPYAFRDLNPQAAADILIVPREHIG